MKCIECGADAAAKLINGDAEEYLCPFHYKRYLLDKAKCKGDPE